MQYFVLRLRAIDFGVTVVDRHTRKTPIEYAGKLFTLERFNEDVL